MSIFFRNAYANPPSSFDEELAEPGRFSVVSEKLLIEAVNDCFHVELERDENVMVMGEDVGRAGGVFRATPACGTGSDPTAAWTRRSQRRGSSAPRWASAWPAGGLVARCNDAFSYPCLDQLDTHVGRYRRRTGGAMEFPVTIRMPYGGVKALELHDDSPEAYYVHTPGVKVAIPSTPADAKALGLGLGDPGADPVVILEPKLHYRRCARRRAGGRVHGPLGEARLAREGTDVTPVAYGSMVPLCEQAADALAGEASVEVLDLRSLKLLDEESLLALLPRRSRRDRPGGAANGWLGAELAAILAEKAILDLRGPVIRVTGYDVPVPVLADRGRVHAVRRAGHGRRAQAARVRCAGRSSGAGSIEPRMEIARPSSTAAAERERDDRAGYELRYSSTGTIERDRRCAGGRRRPRGTDYFDLNFSPSTRAPLLDGLEEPTDYVMTLCGCRAWRSSALEQRYEPLDERLVLYSSAISLPRSSSTRTGSSRGTSGSPSAWADGPARAALRALGASRALLARARAGSLHGSRRHGRDRDAEPCVGRRARRAAPGAEAGRRHHAALAGPIEVRGAKAGQTLIVRIEEVARALGRDVRRREPRGPRISARGSDALDREPRPEAVPRRHGHAAGARRPLDDSAAALGRESRLQGARRRFDALPSDSG